MQCLRNPRSIGEVTFLHQPLHGDREAVGNDLNQIHLKCCLSEDSLPDMRTEFKSPVHRTAKDWKLDRTGLVATGLQLPVAYFLES